MGSSADWTATTEALADRYRTVAVDLPGHGRSTGRAGADYTVEGAATAVIQALQAVVDDGPPALIGYSMGGRVALCAALSGRLNLQALVLESTSPGTQDEADRTARRRTDAERARRIRDDLEGFLADWYRQPLFASLARHDLVDEMVARRAQNAPNELARAVEGFSPGRQASLWERLPDLQIPTLALTGALDPKYPDLIRRMGEQAPRVESALVEGAGHNVHAERPAAFQRRVRRFLDIHVS
jgi:2-succinyl-6-hydroxy-2,4-cyclohexadiene-1-carboxylate synthase